MKKATIGSRSYVRQNPETHSYLKLEEGDRRDAVCKIFATYIKYHQILRWGWDAK